MLVLPVWTQVESKKLTSHLCVQFEAVVIYNKLTFVITFPPQKFWWENNHHQKNWNHILWFVWITPEHGGEGLTCSAIKNWAYH